MLDIKIHSGTFECRANGTNADLLKDAMEVEKELHRFVYRLGPAQYAAFLLGMLEITQSDAFYDFLKSDPDEETHITMPILNREDEKDGE